MKLSYTLPRDTYSSAQFKHYYLDTVMVPDTTCTYPKILRPSSRICVAYPELKLWWKK